MTTQQLIISGVGGQGILFVTRLLAETAITKGMPVLTSETHGMAQRGGIVISHLKVGAFSSPLVRPGQADGLIALKPENVGIHRHFLHSGGWIAANAATVPAAASSLPAAVLDADRLALDMGAPQAVNLMVLGLALAEPGRLFCTAADIENVLRGKLAGKPGLLDGSLAALRIGLQGTHA